MIEGKPLLLALLTVAPMYGDTTQYVFHFQTQAAGKAVPTGGFGFDSTAQVLSNFVALYEGTSFDFGSRSNSDTWRKT